MTIILVGNKIDDAEKRQVSTDEGQQKATDLGVKFIETSAKEKIGVNEAFEEVVNKVLESPMIEEV